MHSDSQDKTMMNEWLEGRYTFMNGNFMRVRKSGEVVLRMMKDSRVMSPYGVKWEEECIRYHDPSFFQYVRVDDLYRMLQMPQSMLIPFSFPVFVGALNHRNLDVIEVNTHFIQEEAPRIDQTLHDSIVGVLERNHPLMLNDLFDCVDEKSVNEVELTNWWEKHGENFCQAENGRKSLHERIVISAQRTIQSGCSKITDNEAAYVVDVTSAAYTPGKCNLMERCFDLVGMEDSFKACMEVAKCRERLNINTLYPFDREEMMARDTQIWNRYHTKLLNYLHGNIEEIYGEFSTFIDHNEELNLASPSWSKWNDVCFLSRVS